jgi:hypothetical protein
MSGRNFSENNWILWFVNSFKYYNPIPCKRQSGALIPLPLLPQQAKGSTTAGEKTLNYIQILPLE